MHTICKGCVRVCPPHMRHHKGLPLSLLVLLSQGMKYHNFRAHKGLAWGHSDWGNPFLEAGWGTLEGNTKILKMTDFILPGPFSRPFARVHREWRGTTRGSCRLKSPQSLISFHFYPTFLLIKGIKAASLGSQVKTTKFPSCPFCNVWSLFITPFKVVVGSTNRCFSFGHHL